MFHHTPTLLETDNLILFNFVREELLYRIKLTTLIQQDRQLCQLNHLSVISTVSSVSGDGLHRCSTTVSWRTAQISTCEFF